MYDLSDIFSRIYREHQWGWPSAPRKNDQFYSGGGTEIENDRNGAYIKLLQEYVDKPDVKTVVEVGCGDWEVSNRIDWSSIEAYSGFDVALDVVRYNNEHYESRKVKFYCRDLIGEMNEVGVMQDGIITADLLIVKDVFQHLPSSYCAEFVKSIPNRFRYNLITNDYGGNTEIALGGYSGNDFTAKPFFMKSELLIQWVQKSSAAGNKQTVALS